MVERRNVEFAVDGGDRLRGWLFLPSKPTGRLPAVSLAHGYAGVKEHGLERFACAFAKAGFRLVAYTYGGIGTLTARPTAQATPEEAALLGANFFR